jgi:hypothetical protein
MALKVETLLISVSHKTRLLTHPLPRKLDTFGILLNRILLKRSSDVCRLVKLVEFISPAILRATCSKVDGYKLLTIVQSMGTGLAG